MIRLLANADALPSSPILVTLMMEAIHSSEIWAVIKATGRNIPENGILITVKRLHNLHDDGHLKSQYVT
jgi:hypothetical protein